MANMAVMVGVIGDYGSRMDRNGLICREECTCGMFPGGYTEAGWLMIKLRLSAIEVRD
jgi:hypothetical protein